MAQLKNRPVVLIILDGWGVAPEAPGNAISQAKTPHFDKYVSTYPAMTLKTTSDFTDEKGSSEIGHLCLGTGRHFQKDLVRINNDIKTGDFFNNQAFLETINYCKKNKSNLHLIGLLSNGGVHSHIAHLFALLELAKKEKVKNIYIHAILDGWDTPYNSAKGFIEELLAKIKELKINAQIATICGRVYAMDRIGDWEKTEKYFQTLTLGQSEQTFSDPLKALEYYYEQEIYDDKILPTVLKNKDKPLTVIKDLDSVIFFNFRADRAKQLTKAFVLPEFNKFDRQSEFNNLFFCSFTNYDKDLPVDVFAYPDLKFKNPLAKCLSNHNFKQLHITETEKFPHLTFYFNGKRNEPFEYEDWLMVPSLKIDAYDKKPALVASKITNKLLKILTENKYDFITVNYANADLVSHTGNLKKTIKACQILDKQLGKIIPFILSKNGLVIITADHGNAEELQNIQIGDVNTEHSNNPVPFIVISNQLEGKNIGLPDSFGADLSLIKPVGSLADIAPTILKIMDIEKPSEMTGKELI
jgi:2,3-bisphosphoglycerate-independent phosphoglycerate mutase